MKDNHIDKALHDVMERRAEKIPALSDDFAEQVMGKMNARKRQQQHRASTPLHHGRGWGWVLSIAAILILAFILWPKPDVSESPSLATNDKPKEEGSERSASPVISTPIDNNAILAEAKDETKQQQPKRKKRADSPPALPVREGAECLDGSNLSSSEVIAPSLTGRAGGESGESSEEEVSPIPTYKQALADIYLAEEALQVAYELRAQQEAIRAYAASLAGEEVPKPVVAY